MEEARHITHADGRTLYMKSDDGKSMRFEIVRTDTMDTLMGGTSAVEITWPAMPLFNEDGEPNHKNVVCYVAHTGETSNVKVAYVEEGFDFSGAKKMDKSTGYLSKSFLTVPLKNHENEIIGVMQLLNSIDQKTGRVQSFSTEMQEQIESLASQGAVALTNKRLVADLKNLFESFIQLMATAIDEKSPYTGAHCERVPEIALNLAEAVEKMDKGPFKDFKM